MNKILKISSITAGAVASFYPLAASAENYSDASAAGGALAGFAIFFLLLMMIFWVGILLLWIFWLVMIIDITKRDWKNAGDRAAYLVLVIFMNIIGALIYYFAVKRHLDNKKK
jgi:hypothetical protein